MTSIRTLQKHYAAKPDEEKPTSEKKDNEKRECPDYFEEEDPEEQQLIRKARINAFIYGVIFIIIGLVSAYFGYQLFLAADPSTSLFSTILLMVGLVLLLFGGSSLISALAPLKEPEPIKITTELRCRQCDYKATRPFKRGDYIFLETETCAKCKAPTYIWGIYSSPPLTEAEKKILAEDL